jgi:hypothetical protein
VGEVRLMSELDSVTASDPVARSGPFADTVDGEDRRLLEGGGEERACRVGLMVLG